MIDNWYWTKLIASWQPPNPGLLKAQLDALSFCITTEANALGPGLNY